MFRWIVGIFEWLSGIWDNVPDTAKEYIIKKIVDNFEDKFREFYRKSKQEKEKSDG
jgi:uncharacterized protein Yka (UPF0111/DUF47 family)